MRSARRFHIGPESFTSAEGNATAFVGYWQGDENLPSRTALWAVDAFDGELHTLYDGGLYFYRAEWRPGGRAIAMTGDTLGYAVTDSALPLTIVDLASGRRLEIARPDRSTYVTNIAWSPDGRWLAYNRAGWPRSPGPCPDAGAWIAAADGSSNYRLREPRGVGAWTFVGWQPGNSRLYMSEGGQSSGRSLWISALDGTARRLPIPATRPQWLSSPRTGTRIAVRVKERDLGGAHRVTVCNALGGGDRELGVIDQTCDVLWSNDGSVVAYTDRPPFQGPVTLRIQAADGSDGRAYSAGSRAGYEPTVLRWSPDGSRLGVHSNGWYIVDLRQRTVTLFRGAYFPCGWRSDNRLICRGREEMAILSEAGAVERVIPVPHRD